MKIGRRHSWKKVTAQCLLLALPTILLFGFLLINANSYFAFLQNKLNEQIIYFSAGIVTAIIFYSWRFRFVSTTAILLVVNYFIYQLLSRWNPGEFDAFFLSTQFLVFTLLFFLGWLAGVGFSRARYFTVAWSVVLAGITTILLSKTSPVTASSITASYVPLLAYTFYILYAAELLRNMNEDEPLFAFFLIKRLFGFSLLMVILLLSILLFYKKDFIALEKEWTGISGDGQRESMMKNNKDGTVSNKDKMRMTSSLTKDKRLVFVANLDSYFPDGITPNPLYFTSLYYTKFDTTTQTFEADSSLPSNDLFSPDPSTIPLYFTRQDSGIIKNSMAPLHRKIISADVYKALLSPHDFVAPSAAFFCQPIAVENGYKDQFKSAYRTKMWVSDLNSAYFIYNPVGNPMLEAFQEKRYEELRKAGNYSRVDKKFMDYYTYMPGNQEYLRITDLAKSITRNAFTTVDKMIAIRNFFTSKDALGQPLFKYSDNPGIPGLPSASKLNYFLFENRKGYCAYFAGATLFMLRSLGIPSRIAAGFLTVDRSTKNTGWYWFYADQAHAWVQLYFPGYGWIDFDTTVPDLNTQQSPQPDGTPPMNMQQALLVADGQAISVDTIGKRITMKIEKMLFKDRNIKAPSPQNGLLDVSVASISKDTGTIRLSDIAKGDHIVAISYAEIFKKINPSENDNLSSLLSTFPKPIPIDELKIMVTTAGQKTTKSSIDNSREPINWVKVFFWGLGIIMSIASFIVVSPWLIWVYFHQRAKSTTELKKSAYNKYTAVMYYLNQLGFTRSHLSPAEYAQSIDLKFNTNFLPFIHLYEKIKYSTIPLTTKEEIAVQSFYQPLIHEIQNQTSWRFRFKNFLNIYATMHFFSKATTK